MSLPKRYNPEIEEPRLQAAWEEAGIYHFSEEEQGEIYAIDTPPPTVSGYLHLGHVYSYSHPDFVARFWRMKGRNVFYPMGYDDNGLPTERLVEKRLGIMATEVGRAAFIRSCLEVSEEAEKDYRELWQRLGLSIDWRYTYRTIDDLSRRTSQLSFIDLYHQGLAYRREAPAIWCPECQTAIAQAELNDLNRSSEFITLPFFLEGRGGSSGTDMATLGRRGGSPGPDKVTRRPEDLAGAEFEPNKETRPYIPIATTRPELLPACVAVFVHPEDERYRGLVGEKVRVPLFNQVVPVLEDPGADPQIGSGAVMCCTFGDTADVAWWYTHRLPLIEAIGRDGRMTQVAGGFASLPVSEARRQIKQTLGEEGMILGRQPAEQSVRVHERCDTPVEYIVTRQWFIRILDHKEAFLKAGEQVEWYPEHMRNRYVDWVENLSWDWCISRQRYFGVPFPVWYCNQCGEVILAEEEQLPVDPLQDRPNHPCPVCGSLEFVPETDIFDTWATSSMTPQIVGRWLAADGRSGEGLYPKVFPFNLRPQAHEIIRTWAFYTIVKSHYHFNRLPWRQVLISGWGIAGEGMGKISKSRGGGPMAPLEMIERYSADAVRYWAASTGPGKDSIISEEKIQLGAKLVTKLWNVARFSERFLKDYSPTGRLPELTPADRWILAQLQSLVSRVTGHFEAYDYATAKSEIENFFWRELADNYLEMSKQRLYAQDHPQQEGARYALYHTLLALLKLFAPLLPYVTEAIYQGLFTEDGPGIAQSQSIHTSHWPEPDPRLEDPDAINAGEILVEIATAVRRFKSEHSLPLGSELERLQVVVDGNQPSAIQAAVSDLASITRARQVEFVPFLDPNLEMLLSQGNVLVAIEPGKIHG